MKFSYVRHSLIAVICISAFVASLAPSAALAILFDQNITPDVIFGSGNANGSWTVDRQGGVELGLRAKLRFDAANQPQNVFNSNGDGTYTYLNGPPPGGGFGFATGSPSTAIWNFEFSVNSNFDGTSGFMLDGLTYSIMIDFDPDVIGTNFQTFDPIIITAPNFADHAIGTNATPNGGGSSATDSASYLALLSNNNVAQNSWNMEFFDNTGAGFPFDANNVGTYDFVLSAFSGATQVASTSIQVQVVPEPGTALLLLMGLSGLSVASRRHN